MVELQCPDKFGGSNPSLPTLTTIDTPHISRGGPVALVRGYRIRLGSPGLSKALAGERADLVRVGAQRRVQTGNCLGQGNDPTEDASRAQGPVDSALGAIQELLGIALVPTERRLDRSDRVRQGALGQRPIRSLGGGITQIAGRVTADRARKDLEIETPKERHRSEANEEQAMSGRPLEIGIGTERLDRSNPAEDIAQPPDTEEKVGIRHLPEHVHIAVHIGATLGEGPTEKRHEQWCGIP